MALYRLFGVLLDSSFRQTAYSAVLVVPPVILPIGSYDGGTVIVLLKMVRLGWVTLISPMLITPTLISPTKVSDL